MNIESMSVAKFRRVFSALFPSRPQPADDREAEITLHYARLISASVSERGKAYSEAWLRERGLLVEGVGVAVIPRSEGKRGLAAAKESAMAGIAGEMMTAGVTDASLIKQEMNSAAQRIKEW